MKVFVLVTLLLTAGFANGSQVDSDSAADQLSNLNKQAPAPSVDDQPQNPNVQAVDTGIQEAGPSVADQVVNMNVQADAPSVLDQPAGPSPADQPAGPVQIADPAPAAAAANAAVAPSAMEESLRKENAKRQLEVNYQALRYGAGVGTAPFYGVPGTLNFYKQGVNRPGYNGGYGYGLGSAYNAAYNYGRHGAHHASVPNRLLHTGLLHTGLVHNGEVHSGVADNRAVHSHVVPIGKVHIGLTRNGVVHKDGIHNSVLQNDVIPHNVFIGAYDHGNQFALKDVHHGGLFASYGYAPAPASESVVKDGE